MKTKLLLIIIVLFTTVGHLSAQKEKKSSLCLMYEKYLVGTWQLDTIYLKENVNLGDYKYLYDEKFKELRDSTIFEFNKDFTYEKIIKGNKTSGKWRISADGTQIITTKLDNNIEEKSKVLELNDNVLIMSPLTESSNSKVILKKIKPELNE